MTSGSRWRLIGWAATLAVVAAVGWRLRNQWSAAAGELAAINPQWGTVALSALLVLAAYLVLVFSWMTMMRDAGAPVQFGAACRMWFVSNLARLIPGSFWQIGALAALARDAGTSASAAASASLVNTALNLACGIIVAIAAGAQDAASQERGWWIVGLALLGLLALRLGAAPLTQLAARLTGKEIKVPTLSGRALLTSIAGNSIAWIAYGVAFSVLAGAVMPDLHISARLGIAVYTGSYLAGLLAVAPPAGLGVADGAMVALLTSAGTATEAQAVVLAAIVRIWRTVLEVAPGLFFLAAQRWRARRIP